MLLNDMISQNPGQTLKAQVVKGTAGEGEAPGSGEAQSPQGEGATACGRGVLTCTAGAARQAFLAVKLLLKTIFF